GWHRYLAAETDDQHVEVDPAVCAEVGDGLFALLDLPRDDPGRLGDVDLASGDVVGQAHVREGGLHLADVDGAGVVDGGDGGAKRRRGDLVAPTHRLGQVASKPVVDRRGHRGAL